MKFIKNDYLVLRDTAFWLRIDVKNIFYIEAGGNYSTIKLPLGNEILVSRKLGKILYEIGDQIKYKQSKKFITVGRSHIINLEYLKHIALSTHELILSDGITFYTVKIKKEPLKKLKDNIESGKKEMDFQDE